MKKIIYLILFIFYGLTIFAQEDENVTFLNLDSTMTSRSYQDTLITYSKDSLGQYFYKNMADPVDPLDGVNLRTFSQEIGNPAKIVTVATGGKRDYDTPQEAINSITDASPANKYNVIIAPGSYAGTTTLKDGITLVGTGNRTDVFLESVNLPLTAASVEVAGLENLFMGDLDVDMTNPSFVKQLAINNCLITDSVNIYGDDNLSSNHNIIVTNSTFDTNTESVISGSLFFRTSTTGWKGGIIANDDVLIQFINEEINGDVTINDNVEMYIRGDGSAAKPFESKINVFINDNAILNIDNPSGATMQKIRGVGVTDNQIEILEGAYSGIIAVAPTWTFPHPDSIYITEGRVSLYDNPNKFGVIRNFQLTDTTFYLTDNVTNYIEANYNSGVPEYTMSLTETNNESDIIPVVFFFKESNPSDTLYHPTPWDQLGQGKADKIHERILETERFRRDEQGGLALGESPTRIVTIEGGVGWNGAVRLVFDPLNSNADGLNQYEYDGANWIKTIVTQYNNSQYQGVAGFVSLSPNNYTVNFIYRSLEQQGELYSILSTEQYPNTSLGLSNAINSQQPSNKPPIIVDHCFFAGKIVVQNGAALATEIISFFEQAGTGVTTQSHPDLTGLGVEESGHTGTANNLFGFDDVGQATQYPETDYYLVDGSRNITGTVTANDASFTNPITIADGLVRSDAASYGQVLDVALGLAWQEPVIDFFDPSGGLPAPPSDGDRYISSATANGWNENYIYEYLTIDAAWNEEIPSDGWAVWNETTGVYYRYDIIDGWITFAAAPTPHASTHESGGSDEITYSNIPGIPDLTTYVTASNPFGTDNKLLKSDGTGRSSQASGITISDTDDMSDINSITTNLDINSVNGNFNTVNGSYLVANTTVIDNSRNIINAGAGEFIGTVSGADATSSNEFVTLQQLSSGSGLWTANGNDIYNSNSGNVGIGVIDPDAKLEVAGSGQFINVKSSEKSLGMWTQYLTDIGQDYAVGSKSDKFYISLTTANNTIPSSGTELMTVDFNGNVGIGTISPAELLHLSTDVSTTQIIGSGPNLNSTLKLLEQGVGDVGSYLRYDGANDRFGIFVGNNPPAERLSILRDNGYVGINQTAPSATLDLVGTLQYTDGNQSDGYVLTSDASGNATWQAPSGGFIDPMLLRGDIIHRNSSNITDRLALGATGQLLLSDGLDLSYKSMSGDATMSGSGVISLTPAAINSNTGPVSLQSTDEFLVYDQSTNNLAKTNGTNITTLVGSQMPLAISTSSDSNNETINLNTENMTFFAGTGTSVTSTKIGSNVRVTISSEGSAEWTSDANGVVLTTSSDNVGIGGASDASYKLRVYGDERIENSSGGDVYLSLRTNNALNTSYLLFNDAQSKANAPGQIRYTHSNDKFNIYSGDGNATELAITFDADLFEMNNAIFKFSNRGSDGASTEGGAYYDTTTDKLQLYRGYTSSYQDVAMEPLWVYNATTASNAQIIIITTGTPNVTLPSASTAIEKWYTIVNQTGTTGTISSYKDLTGSSSTSIPANSSITVMVTNSPEEWTRIH